MRIFKEALKKSLGAVLVFVIVSVVNTAVFTLYGQFAEPLIYSIVLGFFFLCVYIVTVWIKEKRACEHRSAAMEKITTEWNNLPTPESIAEEDYEKMISLLGEKLDEVKSSFYTEREDALDYYTTWVHQIKTPISVMRMKLSDDSPEHRALLTELFRIEQYVEMVLQYIRLGSTSNDLVIKEYPLDGIIKESIHRFAPQFVEKRIRLEYAGTDKIIVTDKKWFSCILDQILSNALKYTQIGTIGIKVEGDTLKISDTGIGIANEDIPRIFEKGYTGYNGRIGEKSTGLGLYLSKKASELISVPLSVESKVGVGSTFILDIRQDEKKEYVRE